MPEQRKGLIIAGRRARMLNEWLERHLGHGLMEIGSRGATSEVLMCGAGHEAMTSHDPDRRGRVVFEVPEVPDGPPPGRIEIKVEAVRRKLVSKRMELGRHRVLFRHACTLEQEQARGLVIERVEKEVRALEGQYRELGGGPRSGGSISRTRR